MAMNALMLHPSAPAPAPAMPARAPQPPSAAPPQTVAGSLKLREMSHTDLAASLRRSAHMRDMSAALLQQPTIAPGHVAAHLGAAVGRGVLTHAEAAHLHGRLPQDPQQIRPAIERLHHDAAHANDALQAEQGARLWGAAPGASLSGVVR